MGEYLNYFVMISNFKALLKIIIFKNFVRIYLLQNLY